MGPDLASAFRDRPSQYAGEDTRLTSKRELAGWYAYGFAAEVFAICGIGELLELGWHVRLLRRSVVVGILPSPTEQSEANFMVPEWDELEGNTS